MLKKYLVFLLVSVLALCSLCAFPTRESKLQSQQVELLPLEPIMPVSVSEETPEQSESSVQSLSDDAILALIDEKITSIEQESSFLVDEVKRLEEENVALQTENTELAIEVAKRDVMIDNQKKMKTFIRLGGEVGWQDNILNYGLSGAAGLRFSNGISLGVSLSYSIGNQAGMYDFSKNNIKATAFIEFEFQGLFANFSNVEYIKNSCIFADNFNNFQLFMSIFDIF